MSAALAESQRTLIDELLAEQQRLTAVDRFSRRHSESTLPAQARYYRDLIPRTKPGAGQQYAFAVELDACTGCKACVSACHSLNGLDEDEIWRSVGMLHGSAAGKPYLQTVTTACHHCVEPGCLEGCPVMAYDKDLETGIVRHLDDQCIGCQYCVLKCPYDVPKYSEKLGIVRKCDMCTNRLAEGEAPACVQACPTHAIRIELVDKAEVSRAAQPGTSLVPGAFDSDYTIPTTRYRTRRPMPHGTRPGDGKNLRLEHAHWPLIGMLLLTQMSVGLYAAIAVVAFLAPAAFEIVKAPLAIAAFAILNAGLAVSILHLGRPMGAWRFFLGLRTSWMSREILAFSILAGAAGSCTLFSSWQPLVARVPALQIVERFVRPDGLAPALAALTALLGFAGIFCSGMIYVDTRRPFWSGLLTFPRFFGSAALLGTLGAAVFLSWDAALATPGLQALIPAVIALGVLLRTGLFAWESAHFLASLKYPAAPTHRSSLTIRKLCPTLLSLQPRLFVLSVTFALMGLVSLPLPAAVFATIAFLLTAFAQLNERTFYFTAVVAPRMPGGIAA